MVRDCREGLLYVTIVSDIDNLTYHFTSRWTSKIQKRLARNTFSSLGSLVKPFYYQQNVTAGNYILPATKVLMGVSSYQ